MSPSNESAALIKTRLCISEVLSVICWAAVGVKVLVAAGSLAYIRTLSIVRGVKIEGTWPKLFFFSSLLQPLSAKTSPSFPLKCKQVQHNSVVVTRQQPLPSAQQSRDGKGAGPCACVRVCHFTLLQHTRLSLRWAQEAWNRKKKKKNGKCKWEKRRFSAKAAVIKADILDLS